jgi:CobQ-like glutamine amidotransferase family enzyme
VCAGFQLLGTSFPDRTGQARDGLGLLDVTTTKGTGPRAVGELMAVPVAGAPTLPPDGRALPALTGFENHGGVTAVGAGATPLARVVGTYLHGPVLARNTGLADLLLWWTLESVGADGPWPELDDHLESALRHQRLEAAQRRASGGLARRLRRV